MSPIDPKEAAKQPPKVIIRFEGSYEMPLEEVFTDGDAPENPTAEQVIDALEGLNHLDLGCVPTIKVSVGWGPEVEWK